MLFSSAIFIFFFLPIVIFFFYLAKDNLKNTVLLFASLIFYAWGGVSYTIILIISIALNYIFGILISKKKKSKLYLTIGVTLNLVILVVFKYADFIVENINSLNTLINIKPIKQPNIILPIGISFFTFQAISYLVDIYRKEVIHQKSIVNLALYISLFPQLIAGPIVRYHDIANQLLKRAFSLNKFGKGVERFIIGLSKKVLLANNFAIVADTIFNSKNYDDLSSPTAWIGIISYSFQIYFDFSGYSDMAIGLGKMFGFNFLENFNFPYISQSIKEFWRRWHISLSTWFRDYLYIPLGGNRVSKYRVYINLIIVFVLTGFWHGASWSFLFWGIFHGFFLILEKIGLGKLLNKIWQPFRHIYTLLVVLIAWVFFRVETIDDAFIFVKNLFISNAKTSNWNIYFDNQFIIVAIFGIISSTNFFPWFKNILETTVLQNSFVNSILRSTYILVLLTLFYLSTSYLLSGTYNPFIYFRF